MIRKLKILGLALVAAFALSAVVASAASAQNGLLTAPGPMTLIGTQTGGAGSNALTAFGLTTECSKATYAGHKLNSSSFIASGESKVTITPKYGTCSTSGLPTTVDMNGCDYVFELGGTVVANTYKVNATVKCTTPGSHIVVTVFADAAHKELKCTVTVEPVETTDYTGLHATDTGNGFLDITGTVEGIFAHKSGTSILCKTTENTTNAKLDLDVTVEGKNESGAKTSISLSHN